MKKILLLVLILTSVKLTAFADNLDSLKQQLQATTNDTLKADLYLRMAQAYLDLKAPNHVYKERNGENAVNYTMLALHLYSRMEDTTGLRKSYTSLARGYRVQKHYTQAKWFMIQSSVLAKGQKDIPNMISSLVELASIKMEMGDYASAKKDLSYALHLTSKYNVADYQSDIIQGLAIANNGLKDSPDAQQITDMGIGTSTIITENPNAKPVVTKAVQKNTKAKSKKYYTAAKKTTKPVKTMAAVNDLAAL